MSSMRRRTDSLVEEPQVRCGIDLGTSYLKVSFVDESDRTVGTTRRRSPVSSVLAGEPMFRPFAWFEEVLSAVAQAASRVGEDSDATPSSSVTPRRCKLGVGRLAFACVSPVVVAIPLDRPTDAVALPYWTLPDVDRASVGGIDQATAGLARTIRRLQHLAPATAGARVAFTDLGGYFVYLLTGRLTLNCASAAEMGIASWSDLDEVGRAAQGVELPVLGSPSATAATVRSQDAHSAMSLLAGWEVSFGGSDSFAAALSTGASRTGDLMVYLGTFASLLRTRDDLAALPVSDPWPRPPYEWVVSVPGFGGHLEARAKAMFPRSGLAEALDAYVDLAGQASAGACGEVLRVPVWGADGLARGSYDLPAATPPRSRRPMTARAVLESPAYPMLALGDLRVGDNPPGTSRTPNASRGSSSEPSLRVAGGGSRSRGWLEIFATALGRDLVVQNDPTGNAGAIVFATAGPAVRESLDATTFNVEGSADRAVVLGNLERLRPYYVA